MCKSQSVNFLTRPACCPVCKFPYAGLCNRVGKRHLPYSCAGRLSAHADFFLLAPVCIKKRPRHMSETLINITAVPLNLACKRPSYFMYFIHAVWITGTVPVSAYLDQLRSGCPRKSIQQTSPHCNLTLCSSLSWYPSAYFSSSSVCTLSVFNTLILFA